ncbi:hypothetical protein E4U60_000223, partial [Claviceps pazoutovae]
LRPDEDPASIFSLPEVYVPLKYIRTWLAQNKDTCATERDLYNVVPKLPREGIFCFRYCIGDL